MNKTLVAGACACLVLCPAVSPAADAENFSQLFKGRDGCFELVDARTGRDVIRYNPTRCAIRLTPCSTFKVPLALMAYQHGLIDGKTVFKWNGQDFGLDAWDSDQTPASWLKYSVVWVSQTLTPRLGRQALTQDLSSFKFGNHDVSGDIQGFWLTTQGTSSLMVSADEQVQFWRDLWASRLPASPSAQAWVRSILPSETGEDGAVLAGKTGTGWLRLANRAIDRHRQLGWFTGILRSRRGSFVLACNTTDLKPDVTRGFAGNSDRMLSKKILRALGLL